MIRVVITGSECTGKTTLAEALADHLGAIWLPEYAREFVAVVGRPPVYADVDAIARGQIGAEEAAIEALARRAAARVEGDTHRVLVQDTDLLSTVVYSRHYYGDCPAWIEHELSRRGADLYLLAGIDVPWVPDGSQRDRGDRREEMQELFRSALLERALPFVEIDGTLDTRLPRSLETIEGLLPRG